MSIEKYLDNIKVPEVHPCPYSVRLKYKLKKTFSEKKRKEQLILKTASSFGLVVFVITLTMIYKPSLASTLHENLLCKTGIIRTDSTEQEQLFAEKRQAEIDLPEGGRSLGMRYQVSQSTASSAQDYQIMELSDLPEETPYIIRKVRDRNNRYIYFVSEIGTQNSRRVPY